MVRKLVNLKPTKNELLHKLEQLRFMDNLRLMFYGIILFIMIFLMPKGVAGFLENIKINFSGFKKWE